MKVESGSLNRVDGQLQRKFFGLLSSHHPEQASMGATVQVLLYIYIYCLCIYVYFMYILINITRIYIYIYI